MATNAVIKNRGEDGQGVPTGGTTGQHLYKVSGTDYNTAWETPGSGLPTGTQDGALLRWETSGSDWEETTAIVVDDSGNIGINTGSTALEANLHVQGTGGWQEGALVDAYGANGTFTVRRANGTVGSPTAVADNDILGVYTFRGYGTTGFNGNAASIYATAAEDFTDTVHGTDLVFYTTATGTMVLAEKMRISSEGIVTGLWNDFATGNADSQFQKLTQAQYDGLTPDADTIYFIVG